MALHMCYGYPFYIHEMKYELRCSSYHKRNQKLITNDVQHYSFVMKEKEKEWIYIFADEHGEGSVHSKSSSFLRGKAR
jgi:hypothetical protein